MEGKIGEKERAWAEQVRERKKYIIDGREDRGKRESMSGTG
jgi:hypothetical protein